MLIFNETVSHIVNDGRNFATTNIMGVLKAILFANVCEELSNCISICSCECVKNICEVCIQISACTEIY